MRKALVAILCILLAALCCGACFSPVTEGMQPSPSPPQKPQPPDSPDEDAGVKLTVNGAEFSARLNEGAAAKAFAKLLPLALNMSELNGNEKYFYLPQSLPAEAVRPSVIHAGDIMLYGSNCLVLFYETFSSPYSYTPIGKIADAEGLADALGTGSVSVAFTT